MEEKTNRKINERKINPGILFDIFLVAILSLTLIIFILSHSASSISRNILAIVAVIGLVPVLASALNALKRRQLTIDLLASVALIFALLAQEWSSAVFISLMIASARLFERITEARAKRIVESLFKFRPERVKLKRGDEVIEVPYEKIKIGDLVIVESGDRLPVDGRVVSGKASINQSTLTGESEPVAKREGDRVLSGTLNESGSLLVEAEKVGLDTALSKMIFLITAANQEKIPIKRAADKFTAWYISVILVFSLVFYFAWGNLNFILAVLLVVCADDVAVAIPLSFSIGIVRAARKGILVKNAKALELLPKIKTFVADKTGTLTRGAPKVTGIVAFDDFTRRDLLEMAATAEVNSNHPAGRAIVSFAEAEKTEVVGPDEFIEFPGDGIFVSRKGRSIWAGKADFLKKNGIKFSKEEERISEDLMDQGQSVTAVGIPGRVAGFLALEDEIRTTAVPAIEKTRKLGVDFWVMLTGDNDRVAARVARELGINEWRANLRPEDKLDLIRQFKKQRGRIAMIGDGVNDAAALALADVSIAMGAIGSDAAIEAADIALMHDDLTRLPDIIILGRNTMSSVRETFWIWGITNTVGLALVFLGILGPLGASAFNFITDFIPIINVFRKR